MPDSLGFVTFLILVALVFDFLNGFHDSANAISTVVSTRVLPPKYAVLWAAFFEFAAVFFIGVHVANTIGTGIINPAIVNDSIVLAALGGAITWNIITWYFGLPSSSSHALIGGLIGAGVLEGGIKVLVWNGIIKTAVFIVLSPAIGMVLGLSMMILVFNLSQSSSLQKTNRFYRRLQLLSSAIYCMGHGSNDAQKTMGVIAMILFSHGMLGPTFFVPTWVIIACYLVISLGIMSGGWRIVKTMGTKITKLQPAGGFCVEMAAAASIIGASLAGIPVSTTHTVTGAIVGVGSTKRLTAVRWGVAGNIVWAWILTIPMAALISAAIHVATHIIW
ncbi:MAG: inorganic phosphate transporter [Syntrophales bacterium]|jgi:PiT family inorganic phosphate transporter